MFRKLRSLVSYANVTATLALFLALGGTSYALIINGALVQDESLTGADVRNDSLRGADVDESSLGTVPAADNAHSLGFYRTHADTRGTSGFFDDFHESKTVECGEDAIAVRGNYGTDHPVTATESYGRSSYTVTVESASNDDTAFGLQLLCLRTQRPNLGAWAHYPLGYTPPG